MGAIFSTALEELMNQFIETLKARMEDAQKRFQEATQKLQAAQLEHQSAAQEFASWQHAFQAEMRRQNPNVTLKAPTEAAPNVALHFHIDEPMRQATSSGRSETNKTDVVRQLLQQHPAGMSPGELWKNLSSELKYRPYLYSILKRLRDRGDVYQKRGKYFPRMVSKGEEDKGQAVVQ